MTDCKFNPDGPPWTCSTCGFVSRRATRDRKPPKTNCGPQESQQAPIDPEIVKPAAEKLGIGWDDVVHYAAALARWTAAGFPVRTQDDVRACLRVCIVCDRFLPNNPECTKEACKIAAGGRCKDCACNVTQSRFAVTNKAKMATEDCPLGKWPGRKG
ncbi:MAG: hypothetical protein IMZ69_02625 [Spirochaetes bacterium]|nr:hypothetical protein [Spirochaetota bacterium]